MRFRFLAIGLTFGLMSPGLASLRSGPRLTIMRGSRVTTRRLLASSTSRGPRPVLQPPKGRSGGTATRAAQRSRINSTPTTTTIISAIVEHARDRTDALSSA